MSGKTMKKLRRALRNIEIDVDDTKRYRHPKTLQIVASRGRRIYKAAKRKASQMRREGRVILKNQPAAGEPSRSD